MSKIILAAPMINVGRGATDLTRLKDVIVPEIFAGYVTQKTMEKSAIIQSGAATVDAGLNALLAGAGLTFNQPFFNDLKNEDEYISSDTGGAAGASNITTGMEQQIRLSRNMAWGSADLVAALIAKDPMMVIAELAGGYWARRHQAAFIATMKGLYANNATASDEFHQQNDMSHSVIGSAFADGVTNFSASAFINACGTMGDAAGELSLICVHSVVYQRMQLLNLIDAIPDQRGEVYFNTYQGKAIVVDDGMPHDPATGTFESWIFGAGAVKLGMGSAKVPLAVTRDEDANNGGGEEKLRNRVEWIIHPAGHAYINANPVAGGPSNAATTGNLANASSWKRVFKERKQIKMARLVTREYAAS